MSCNTMRDLEYEREQERKRKKKKELQLRLQKEKRRREKALKTIQEQAFKLQWILKESPGKPGMFHMYKPGSKDFMDITVFEDGRVRVDSPGVISKANHPSSDAFMNNLRDILKGKWRTVKQYLPTGNAHSHGHMHAHGHTH